LCYAMRGLLYYLLLGAVICTLSFTIEGKVLVSTDNGESVLSWNEQGGYGWAFPRNTQGQSSQGRFIDFPFAGRSNKLYIPSSSTGSVSLPLFVMLHGCTQNPTDFSKGTKMNEVAEKYGFFVLYPEQPSSANMNKCWNWFEPAHQTRGGEPKIIVDMLNKVSADYRIDRRRVYVAGLSAGAAMSVIVGIVYSEVFAGIGVGAGLEWKAATSTMEALTAMSKGGPNPVTQGRSAYQTEGSRARIQGILVIHGTSDSTVALINGKQVVTQFATTLDLILGNGQTRDYISDVPTDIHRGQVPGGRSFTLYEYADTKPGHGKVLIKFLEVQNMGHAWSGGSTAGTYTDPQGPDASVLLAEWFLSSFPPTNGTTGTTTGTTQTTSPTTGTTQTTSPTTGTTSITSGGSTTGDMSKVITLMAIPRESGFVGRFPADGYSDGVAKAGDKGMYNTDTYRAIFSFDTGALPVGTNVSSAFLRVVRKSLTGTINDLLLDIKGGYFGSSPEIQQADYSATPSAAEIALVPIPSTDGGHVDVQMPFQVLRYMQPGLGYNGRVQFRIHAETTASFFANAIEFYAGEVANPEHDTSLIVKLA
jgi:poly(hydroxyalkanoate) depolymerase family esterase